MRLNALYHFDIWTEKKICCQFSDVMWYCLFLIILNSSWDPFFKIKTKLSGCKASSSRILPAKMSEYFFHLAGFFAIYWPSCQGSWSGSEMVESLPFQLLLINYLSFPRNLIPFSIPREPTKLHRNFFFLLLLGSFFPRISSFFSLAFFPFLRVWVKRPTSTILTYKPQFWKPFIKLNKKRKNLEPYSRCYTKCVPRLGQTCRK